METDIVCTECGERRRNKYRAGMLCNECIERRERYERELELAYEREMEERQDAHERFLLSREADYLFENGRGE